MKCCGFSLLLFLIFLAPRWCSAQSGAHLPGQILISLRPDVQPDLLLRRMAEDISRTATASKKVSGLLNVWLLSTDPVHESVVLEWLQRQPEVRLAQFNHPVDLRDSGFNALLPDDPLFPQQWQYINTGANGGVPDADLDAELAWNITTGGLTPAGDTIVVAVIDGGIDQTHSDLVANLWKNRAEIPNDGIDNDNNGYIDDYRGWNVYNDNDNITGAATGHGTPVSAIISAKGNNSNGVTGINWNVKLMFIAGGSAEDYILSAYDYVLQSRRRYNASNGAAGAFVVAVNCSWGTDYGQPADAPLWCAFLDSLGSAGILSIAATANNPVNVDQVGDLPTTCPSDYLISVTSLTKADLKAPDAAWGATHIDLGAYGQGVFTAGANNSYGAYTGTSFASPQVAGALGLLYSSPCPNLISLAKTDPAAAALWARQLILDGTDPNAAMQGITATNGRLNLNTMLLEYENQCSPCPAPFALYSQEVTTTSALLKWSEIADFQSVKLRWRVVGAPAWNETDDVTNNYLLKNLQPCTLYEFSLSAQCDQGLSSDWAAAVVFKTDGCCEPPAAVWVQSFSETTASIAWNKITAANGYRLRIRDQGGNWEQHDVFSASLNLENLLPCTDYEVQVQTLCDTGATNFSAPVFFKTLGCGSCTDALYCNAKAVHSDDEWVISVQIGSWKYESGAGGDGYQDFTASQPNVLQLEAQSVNNVTIVPGFNGFSYKEYFRIYIDFNLDGDFSDSGELAFSPGWATDSTCSGLLTAPAFQAGGLSRMRVMMKYKGTNNLPPNPCETFDFGQVEDYCVQLLQPVSTHQPNTQEHRLRIYPQPAADGVTLEIPAENPGACFVSVLDATGRRVFGEEMQVSSNGAIRLNTGAWPQGAYFVQVGCAGTQYRGKLILGRD